MATGKDEPETLILNLPCLVLFRWSEPSVIARKLRLDLFREKGLPPEAVDGLVARGLDNPGARHSRDTASRPLLQSSRKCFLRILFGQIEIAQQPDQRGYNPPPVRAVNSFDGQGRVDFRRHTQLYEFFGIDVDLGARRSIYV